MAEESAVPRQISRAEYIVPKTEQETEKAQSDEVIESEDTPLRGPQQLTMLAQLKPPVEVSTAREKKCWFCLQIFSPKNSKAHFCSTRHRVAYFRRKRKLEQKQEQFPPLQKQPLANSPDVVEDLCQSYFWQRILNLSADKNLSELQNRHCGIAENCVSQRFLEDRNGKEPQKRLSCAMQWVFRDTIVTPVTILCCCGVNTCRLQSTACSSSNASFKILCCCGAGTCRRFST